MQPNNPTQTTTVSVKVEVPNSAAHNKPISDGIGSLMQLLGELEPTFLNVDFDERTTSIEMARIRNGNRVTLVISHQ